MNGSGPSFEAWRLFLGLLIVFLGMGVIYQVIKTCRDIASCKDDCVIYTPPLRLSGSRGSCQRQDHLIDTPKETKIKISQEKNQAFDA